MNIMFWNTNKKDRSNLVCKAAEALNVEVIALIESKVDPGEMLKALKSKVSHAYFVPRATTGRIQLFCRNTTLNFDEVYSGPRLSMRQASVSGANLNLGFVHLVDKDNFDEQKQLTLTGLLVAEIGRIEKNQGHSRTIIIGDFNMNPFDRVMNEAGGMNAMMTEKCVKSISRTFQFSEYEFFYNPMWNLLGDRTPGPPGTFYHSNSNKGHFGWNMPDQVLLRPSAIPWFNEVRILTKFGDTLLDTKMGRPNRRIASDHFPILVTLKGG